MCEALTIQLLDPTDKLTHSMGRLDLVSLSRNSPTWKKNYTERTMGDLPPDGFDEGRFTDNWFGSMEVDIADDDMGFGVYEDGPSESEGEETE